MCRVIEQGKELNRLLDIIDPYAECTEEGESTDDLGLTTIHISIAASMNPLSIVSIYTLSDLGVLSNLTGSLSLANEHYSPPTE